MKLPEASSHSSFLLVEQTIQHPLAMDEWDYVLEDSRVVVILGEEVWYGVIDGRDTQRLIEAYPWAFKAK